MKQYSLFWKKHQFKVLVISSILFMILLRFIRGPVKGTWSTDYNFDNIPKTIRTFHYKRESNGEAECRRVMESLFKRPFPKQRPRFLYNSVTKSPLEIDCCNMDLKLGVEYNGRQHYEFVKGMHKNTDAFRTQQYRDYMKNQKCLENGFTLITVPYNIPVESIENYIIDKLREKGYYS